MIDNYKKLLEETVEEIMEDLENETDDIPVGDHIMIYTEDPYQIIEKNDEKHYYQIIGNEIITITRGRGVCCLCQTLTEILYTDNTYNNNIPVQICKQCIDAIMKEK
jgi:hypothetical protein